MKIRFLFIISILVLVASSCRCPPKPVPANKSTVSVKNDTDANTVVYISFGSNSAILPSSVGWNFCTETSKLTCNFPLSASQSQDLPLAGQFLNATIAFGAAVGCGSTKAEMAINNPAWYDVLDVSLVDGYSNKISISVSGSTILGPPIGVIGNEKIFGIFPLGCDICVARQAPPCGIAPGKWEGCKSGTQYAPNVPCQYQGPTMGGGSLITVSLVK